MVLVRAVQFQLKAREEEHDHDAKTVVEHPRPEARQVRSRRFTLLAQAVQEPVYVFCLKAHVSC